MRDQQRFMHHHPGPTVAPSVAGSERAAPSPGIRSKLLEQVGQVGAGGRAMPFGVAFHPQSVRPATAPTSRFRRPCPTARTSPRSARPRAIWPTRTFEMIPSTITSIRRRAAHSRSQTPSQILPKCSRPARQARDPRRGRVRVAGCRSTSSTAWYSGSSSRATRTPCPRRREREPRWACQASV